MENHRSFHSRVLWILRIGLIGAIFFMACQTTTRLATSTPTPKSGTASPAREEQAQTPGAEATAQTQSTATLTATKSDPTPTQPGQDLSAGVSFDYQAIPLGNELELILDGRKIAIKINKVISGIEANSIAFSKAPEEMRWAVVQLLIRYVDGAAGERAQLLDSSMFSIVSNGTLDLGGPWISYTPSPRVEDALLLPGEQSLAYLSYIVYQNDPAPLLRFTAQEEERFFALSEVPLAAVDPEKSVQLAGRDGIGTKDQPIPAGTPAYVQSGGAVYKIQIEKALRGFNALKKIKDGWGINDDPPAGKEFLMPYLTISVARADEIITPFYLGDISSYSNQEQLDQPFNFFCPLPCLQSADLYPNASFAGWVPLIAYQDDPAPLLVFGNSIYFQVVSEQDAEMTYQRQFSPDAIGYPNRDKIKPFIELKQTGPVNAIAFSPDDSQVVTAGDDKTLHVWDIAGGKELYTLKEHQGSIKEISFSPDGSLLASISSTGEVIVWETAAWTPAQKWNLKGNGRGVRFLPDGSLLTASTAGTLQIWDATSGQEQRQELIPRSVSPSCGGASLLSFDASSDGSILAASLSCGYAVIWEMGNPQLLLSDFNRQDDYTQLGNPLPSSSKITLSPDGKMAVYGMVYYTNRRLMLMDILDVENKQVVASVSPIEVNVIAARVAPNKDLMMAGVGSKVLIWWPEAYVWGGDNLIQLTEHKTIVTVINYSTRGEILATGDYSGRTILWSGK
jgi:WD40 repeat protein